MSACSDCLEALACLCACARSPSISLPPCHSPRASTPNESSQVTTFQSLAKNPLLRGTPSSASVTMARASLEAGKPPFSSSAAPNLWTVLSEPSLLDMVASEKLLRGRRAESRMPIVSFSLGNEEKQEAIQVSRTDGRPHAGSRPPALVPRAFVAFLAHGSSDGCQREFLIRAYRSAPCFQSPLLSPLSPP